MPAVARFAKPSNSHSFVGSIAVIPARFFETKHGSRYYVTHTHTQTHTHPYMAENIDGLWWRRRKAALEL